MRSFGLTAEIAELVREELVRSERILEDAEVVPRFRIGTPDGDAASLAEL